MTLAKQTHAPLLGHGAKRQAGKQEKTTHIRIFPLLYYGTTEYQTRISDIPD